MFILPKEIRFCQPGPSSKTTHLSNGTCRLEITHEALLPGGTHEFCKHRGAPVATLTSGKVLRLARTRWLLGAGASLIFAAAVLFFWRSLGRTILDPIIGTIDLLLALGGFITCLRWLWPRDRRLVIGRDRLQLVDGKDTIAGQIPFDQITSVHFFHGEEEEETFFYKPSVTVRLANLNRPDTFWPGTPNEQQEFVLWDRYECSPAELRKLLRSRWQDCMRQRELADAPPSALPSDVDMIG
jgi:hypothetical protein